MSSVNGVGGVFLYADDPHTLAAWYARRFGWTYLSSAEEQSRGMYYLQFQYRRDDEPSLRWNTTLAILPAPQPRGAGRGDYMINYRVDDLRALAEQLQHAGVTVEPIAEKRDGRTETSTGLFTRLTDPEGNRLELYQPL